MQTDGEMGLKTAIGESEFDEALVEAFRVVGATARRLAHGELGVEVWYPSRVFEWGRGSVAAFSTREDARRAVARVDAMMMSAGLHPVDFSGSARDNLYSRRRVNVRSGTSEAR